MKKIILCALVAMCSIAASAQFEAGKAYFNVSSTGVGLSYSKCEKLNFDLAATAGCFLAQDWMAYGRVGYDHRYHSDNVALGLGVRYYIEQNGIHLGFGGLYEHVTSSINNLYITPEVGYTFFLNQYLTIEPAIYYNVSLNDFSDGSKIGARLGFGFFF